MRMHTHTLNGHAHSICLYTLQVNATCACVECVELAGVVMHPAPSTLHPSPLRTLTQIHDPCAALERACCVQHSPGIRRRCIARYCKTGNCTRSPFQCSSLKARGEGKCGE